MLKITLRIEDMIEDILAKTGSGALLERQDALPRQYMHNKENAVTMRLSAH